MEKGKGLRFIALAVACALALSGCPNGLGSEDGPSIAALSTGQVYTAGYSAGSIRAYYWVDEEFRAIGDAGLGLATKASCVVPTNLGDYVAGAMTELVDGEATERAVVWFNGRGELLDEAPSFAFAAALHGGKIYVAGWRNPDYEGDRPCMWEVTDTYSLTGSVYAVSSRSIIRHDLPTPGIYGEARDIVSSAGNLYVCGAAWDGSAFHACYWKNGERTALVGGDLAMTIAVSAERVYVGGKSAAAARYWIDEFGYDLTGFPVGSTDCIVTAIALPEGELHLGGTFYNGDYRGFSWNAGALITTLPPVIGAGARGVDFYLGCQDVWLKGGEEHLLSWIEGRRPRGIRMRLY